jgi:hypothetical protein
MKKKLLTLDESIEKRLKSLDGFKGTIGTKDKIFELMKELITIEAKTPFWTILPYHSHDFGVWTRSLKKMGKEVQKSIKDFIDYMEGLHYDENCPVRYLSEVINDYEYYFKDDHPEIFKKKVKGYSEKTELKAHNEKLQVILYWAIHTDTRIIFMTRD